MSATTWLIIAIVGFSLSGIALVTAIFMFIKMNIPAVIGDLSGKTLAREIKAMREANASSGDKLHKSSRVNVDRGKLTEKVNAAGIDSSVKAVAHASKRLDRTDSGQSSGLKKGQTGAQKPVAIAKDRTTESLSTNVGEIDIEKRRATTVMSQERTTDVLSEQKTTEILSETRQTEVLSETRQTEVLSEARQTEILSETRQTEVLSETRQTEVLSEARQTEVLSEARQTEILSETRQTEVLSEVRQTEVLSEAEPDFGQRGGTMVLSETEAVVQDSVKSVAFRITKSVIKTHTDEVI